MGKPLGYLIKSDDNIILFPSQSYSLKSDSLALSKVNYDFESQTMWGSVLRKSGGKENIHLKIIDSHLPSHMSPQLMSKQSGTSGELDNWEFMSC